MVHGLIEIILRFGGVGGSALSLYKFTAALCWFGMVIARISAMRSLLLLEN